MLSSQVPFGDPPLRRHSPTLAAAFSRNSLESLMYRLTMSELRSLSGS